ncbi:hypothetical protein AgCh_027618 [Apium graveolens]
MKNFEDIPKIRTTQEVDKLRRLSRHPYPEPKNPLEMEAKIISGLKGNVQIRKAADSQEEKIETNIRRDMHEEGIL